MSIFGFFTRRNEGSSAPEAKERLQLLLAHERLAKGQSELVAKLREEILAVIAKHVPVEQEKVRVKMGQVDQVSTLEVDIELPGFVPMPAA